MSTGTRTSIVPNDAEKAEDARLVTLDAGAVKARVNIPPFTRVAVCFGRVFTTKEHHDAFGTADPWAQWTFVRTPRDGARQGHVVTPGLPGGALDPLFADLGLSPFFTDARKGTEPECVYVLNYKKGRMEYWVGRRGAMAGQTLRLFFLPENNARFPTIYLWYGHLHRPRSVNELAATKAGARPYSILQSIGGWDVGTHITLFRRWAATYDESKEIVPLAHSQNVNEINNPSTRANASVRQRADAYWATRTKKDGPVQNVDNRVVATLKAQRAANIIGKGFRTHMMRSLCSTHQLSDTEVLRAIDSLGALFIGDKTTIEFEGPWYIGMLKLAYFLRHERDIALMQMADRGSIANILRPYLSLPSAPLHTGYALALETRILRDPEPWIVWLGKSVIPFLCDKMKPRG